jgi:hypothetical protein
MRPDLSAPLHYTTDAPTRPPYPTPYGPVYRSHGEVIRTLGFTTGDLDTDFRLFAQRFAEWRTNRAAQVRSSVEGVR